MNPEEILSQMTELGLEYGPKVLAAVAVWVIGGLIIAVLSSGTTKLLDKNKVDPTLKPFLISLIRSLLKVMLVISVLGMLGVEMTSFIAILGAAGLAVGMALSGTLQNFAGGVIILIFKPFKVGDRIVVNGIDGTVQEIGIRSSRIITLQGRMVTIPNNSFTNSPVENITAEPSRKVSITLGLTYDTSPEKVQLAVDILKQIVGDHTETENDFTVWFSSFGDFSLNVSCTYYINKSGHWANTPGGVNMEVLKKFNEAKLDFAFPTQTIIAETA